VSALLPARSRGAAGSPDDHCDTDDCSGAPGHLGSCDFASGRHADNPLAPELRIAYLRIAQLTAVIEGMHSGVDEPAMVERAAAMRHGAPVARRRSR